MNPEHALSARLDRMPKDRSRTLTVAAWITAAAVCVGLAVVAADLVTQHR